MPNPNVYLLHTWLAYLILAIRRARVDRRRPTTFLIMSRNCACITPGGPIEPENFDRCKRQEHGDVVFTYIYSLDYCHTVINLETHLPIFANSPSCHKVASSSSWNSHEPVTNLNFAVSDMRRVTWSWTLCQFHQVNLTRPDFFRIKYARYYMYLQYICKWFLRRVFTRYMSQYLSEHKKNYVSISFWGSEVLFSEYWNYI